MKCRQPARDCRGRGKYFWPIMGVVSLHPPAAWACAACYGQSDSPLAAGMNWGILSLLAVVVAVLGGIVVSFVCLARKAAAVSAAAAESSPPPSDPAAREAPPGQRARRRHLAARLTPICASPLRQRGLRNGQRGFRPALTLRAFPLGLPRRRTRSNPDKSR